MHMCDGKENNNSSYARAYKRCELRLLFMSLPSDIQSQLAPRERVIEYQTIMEGVVSATNRRILLRRIDASKVIESIPYTEILSIDTTQSRRQIGWFIAGIAILLVTVLSVLIFQFQIPDLTYVVIGLISIVMIIVGFYKMPSYTLQISEKDSIKISSRNIEDVIYVIRKYRDRELSR